MLQYSAFAQTVPSREGEIILQSILSLQFERADSLIRHLPQDSDPQLRIYLGNYNTFMLALVSGDRKSYDTYVEMAGDRAEALRKQEGAGTYIRLSYMHLQSSLLSVFHDEFFDAARHYFSAFRFYRMAEEKDSSHSGIPVLKATLDIINGSVPSEYAWLFRILGMRGSVENGLQALRNQAGQYSGSQKLEACLLLMYASIVLDNKEPEKHNSCSLPDEMQAGNPLLVYVRALYDQKAGNSDSVVAMFEGYEQSHDAHHLYFLDLVEGEARLNLLDAGAGKNLEDFIRGYPGDHYKKLAWHKLSWHYFLAGDMQKYQHARAQVTEQGIAVVDADRQALREAQDRLNPVLLKARLLFDGGQYKRALGLLEGHVPMSSLRDSVEFIYRLGRIYDGLGDRENAIVHYSQTLYKGEGMDWYFAPNAALHMGLLYEQVGDAERAVYYFKRCLEVNRSAYKKSIAYRARQGIERVGH